LLLGRYWRLENLASFDDYLARRFPESRRKAYYLMSIHEQLPRQVRSELKQLGWSKAAELAKVARREREQFKSADRLHKARSLSHQQFKEEVEKYLTGSSEASEQIYFKLYKSQVPVVEQALEIAARMLGSDRSRGYCLEMICADFLAGAHAEDESPRTLLLSILRLVHLLPALERQQLVEEVGAAA